MTLTCRCQTLHKIEPKKRSQQVRPHHATRLARVDQIFSSRAVISQSNYTRDGEAVRLIGVVCPRPHTGPSRCLEETLCLVALKAKYLYRRAISSTTQHHIARRRRCRTTLAHNGHLYLPGSPHRGYPSAVKSFHQWYCIAQGFVTCCVLLSMNRFT